MKSQAIERIEVAPGIFAAIYTDESPGNPWEDWDYNPPLLAYSDRSLTPYGEEVRAGDLLDLIPARVFCSRASRGEILEACGIDPEDFATERKNWDGKPQDTARNAIAELIARGWAGNLSRPGHGGRYDDYFSALETLAKFAKVPTYRGTARGCCQGDWAELLLFALPADKDTRFNGADPIGSLKASFYLWESWAFGNVYGYCLETGDTEGEDGDTVEGEEVDFLDPSGHYSCWGYYGYDHKVSGLIDDATSAAEYFLAKREEKRIAAEEKARIEAAESFDAACRDIVTV